MSPGPIWPSIAERTQSRSGSPPPFTGALRDAKQVVIASSAPSPEFFDWLFKHGLPPRPGASCQILIGIDPGRGTIGLQDGLRRLLALGTATAGEPSTGDFEVRLLTPALLGGARPRFELAITTDEGRGTQITLGTSPGFGLDTQTAGDLNLHTPLDPALCNGLRQFVLAMWSLAVPLRPALCEVPDLVPPRGNEEGRIHWMAYEAQIAHGQSDGPATISRLPLCEDGSLDEEELAQGEAGADGEALVEALNQAVPAVSPLQLRLAELFARGSLMAVGQQAKPLSVPVPPSTFGQEAEVRIGAVKQKQSFTIELFDDPGTRRQIEKLRTGASDLLKLFSFSFGHGRYWVPDCARSAMDAALAALNTRAEKEFGTALKGDAKQFLAGRRAAIETDLKAFFGKQFPNRAMPERTTDEVLWLLEKRIDAIQKGGFMPTLSASRVAFDTRASNPATRWSDALTLLRAIVKLPRDLLNDRYPESNIKGSDLSIPRYLKVMNVLDDQLVQTVTDQNWRATWIARAAEAQLDAIDIWESANVDPEFELQNLLELSAESIE
jgi:hypothetical protein